MPVQLTSPSGVAGLQGTPCDVPENVRLGRPRRPRLAMLVSWTGRVPTNLGCIIHEHLTAGPRRAVCKGIARCPSFPVTHCAAALHPSLDPPPL